MLFNGTIRKNLDPFDQHDDASLWRALQEVSHVTLRHVALVLCMCLCMTSATLHDVTNAVAVVCCDVVRCS